MHRTLTLLPLFGLVAACGGGAGGETSPVDDQSPPTNVAAPANYSDTPATSDQAPLNDGQQPGMNEQAPAGGAILGACVGTTTPAEYLAILRRVTCAQVPRCPMGPEGESYWAEACAYLSDCAANPAQCELTPDESIPVCAAGLESCMMAAVESLGCDATGNALEEVDISQFPECTGIAVSVGSEPRDPDPITDDVNGFGGAGG